MSNVNDKSGIIRVKKTRKFFTASNEPFNNQNLSWEAAGLMGYLLSKPDNWTVRNDNLINFRKAGRDKIKRMIRELKEQGYIRRYQERDDRGRIVWVTEVYEDWRQNPDIAQEAADKASALQTAEEAARRKNEQRQRQEAEVATALEQHGFKDDDDEAAKLAALRSRFEAEKAAAAAIDGKPAHGEKTIDGKPAHGAIDGKTADGSPVDGSAVDGSAIDGKPDHILNTETLNTEKPKTEEEKTDNGGGPDFDPYKAWTEAKLYLEQTLTRAVINDLLAGAELQPPNGEGYMVIHTQRQDQADRINAQLTRRIAEAIYIATGYRGQVHAKPAPLAQAA